MNAQRLKCERLILEVMTILDNPKKHDGSAPNVEFWTRKFAKMNDKEFEEFICQPMSIFYQTEGLRREPSMLDIMKGLDKINVPMLEHVYMPYKFTNIDGKPIKSKKAFVGYIHIKRMKQTLALKVHSSFSTQKRDARTGLLTGDDKIGKETDREFESLAISNLDAVTKELSKPRADAMKDKSIMNASIKNMGQVKLKELPDEPTDSLAKNLLNVYMLGCGIVSNMILTDYMTPWTLRNKTTKIQYL